MTTLPNFTVSLYDPKELRNKSTKAKAKPKTETARKLWEELGIEARYMYHPTCPYCGLVDGGKTAERRPDRNHMVSCKHRKLGAKPIHRTPEGVVRERVGSFKGEGAVRTITFPIRLVRKITVDILDHDGNPTGQQETRFICSYRWKQEQVTDWVWNGENWVEWWKVEAAIPDGSADLERQELSKVRNSAPVWFEQFAGKKNG